VQFKTFVRGNSEPAEIDDGQLSSPSRK
jgi:hypothetical protein